MKRILLVLLEFDTWQQARAWSYTGSYAFHDGMIENGDHCTLLPAFAGRSPESPGSFIGAAPSLLAGQTFDEAWVWGVHAQYNDAFWSWLKSVAPVRVGVIMESLTHDPSDVEEFPHLAGRMDATLEQLSHCTHALMADEVDCGTVTLELGIPATWNVPMIPEKRVQHLPPPGKDKAAFIGSNYRKRSDYLADESLSCILERPALPERESPLPQAFDDAIKAATEGLIDGTMDANELASFMQHICAIRGELFEKTIEAIRGSMCSVNLPSIIQAFPGRIFEAIAAGTPNASWKIPNRPLCTALFQENDEINFFSNSTELRELLLALREDTELQERQVLLARNTLLTRHTSRIRVRQYNLWIRTNTAPDFFSDLAYKPDLKQSRFYRDFFCNQPNWSSPKPNSDEKSRWEVIEKFIEEAAQYKDSSLRIAEIGCGRGWLSALLSKYGNVTAVDPVGDVINNARKNHPQINFITGDADLLIYLGKEKQFDLLVCSEVIEHIPHKEKGRFVKQLARLTADGGQIIVTTPRAEMFDQWQEKYGSPSQPIEDWISENDLRNLFAENSFELERIERAFLMDIYQICLFKSK